MFKPHKINFIWKNVKPKDEIKREASYAQLSLFKKNKDPIEFIPYDFRYIFYCQDSDDCQGHDLPIRDWEIFEAYRKWRNQYDNESTLINKIKTKWLDELCGKDKDIYFIVGNTQRFRRNFMVLSVFWPPLYENNKKNI